MKRIVFGIVMLVAVAARAEPIDPQKLYDDGASHYQKGEYGEAIALWQRAFDLTKAPLLLFNLGQAYRLKGDCTKALELYDSYLNVEPHPSDRDQIQQAIGICKQIELEREQREQRERAQREQHEREVEQARLARAKARAAQLEAQIQRDRRLRHGGLITGGAGLAIAITGGAFVLVARARANDVANHTGEWDAAAQRLQDAGKRDDAIGTPMVFGGVAAILTGATLWVLGSRERRVDALVSVTPSGGAIFVRGRL